MGHTIIIQTGYYREKRRMLLIITPDKRHQGELTVPCKSACIDTNCNRRMYEGQAEKKSKVCLGKSREYDPRLKISKTLP